ncbi:MAG: C40 family peptidase [Candidatus Poribacteria bacterium]|nr:C40 family peptidase [Candidatus Poribacteria bacterium]
MGHQETSGDNQDSARSIDCEYHVLNHLDVYDSPECGRLATQARADRHLRILSDGVNKGLHQSVKVRLCEDDYPGWLKVRDLQQLRISINPYRARKMNRADICVRLPEVVSFTQDAMAQPNHYLWGGTVGPHFDCSGLVQAAFASVGIWLPRDAYQQEDFLHPVSVQDVQCGDLLFFGSKKRATHVGLYIGEGEYIHSSGRDHGRDGIGIDRLSPPREEISEWLFQKLRSAGRVIENYQPRESD